MASKRHKKLATFSSISLLMFIVGLVLGAVYLFKFRGQTNTGSVVLMWAAVALTVVGFLFTLISIICFRIEDSRDKKRKEQALDTIIEETSKKRRKKDKRQQPASSATEQPSVQNPAQAALAPQQEQAAAREPQPAPANQTYIVDAANVTYIPSREAYDFIVMGQYQTLDQKFAEIAKMDKTQFVIYVARLFSRKGYQVKLTPVIDNHDIDLLVEKSGITIAVGCILTHKVLCIVCVKNGRSYYGVNNSMALTNMYFDRTALDYAKAEHMSLVDRNILAEEFMI